MDYERERLIRDEERIRYSERQNLERSAVERAEKAECDAIELDRLLEIKEVHGFWSAFLVRSMGVLIGGGILGIMAFSGALMGDQGSFWFRLWEGIKAVLVLGVFTMVVAIWKARKLM